MILRRRFMYVISWSSHEVAELKVLTVCRTCIAAGRSNLFLFGSKESETAGTGLVQGGFFFCTKYQYQDHFRIALSLNMVVVGKNAYHQGYRAGKFSPAITFSTA